MAAFAMYLTNNDTGKPVFNLKLIGRNWLVERRVRNILPRNLEIRMQNK